jgi:hypothetical protein
MREHGRMYPIVTAVNNRCFEGFISRPRAGTTLILRNS